MVNNLPGSGPTVTSAQAVTLLGGGALGPRDLDLALTFAPCLVAADGGAEAALGAGYMPAAVYGDMDSLTTATRAKIASDRVYEIAEQDSTDFDKALRHIEAPLVLAVGFTGDRIDHELAAYHVLVARPDRRCIVIGGTDLVVNAPPDLTLDLPAGTRLSLFPLAAVRGQGTGLNSGLEWPIAGVEFHPATRIGTSNRTTGGPVRLAFDRPGMLLIVPRAHLDALCAAVLAASVWPRPDVCASL